LIHALNVGGDSCPTSGRRAKIEPRLNSDARLFERQFERPGLRLFERPIERPRSQKQKRTDFCGPL
jgi:hypothetical protein